MTLLACVLLLAASQPADRVILTANVNAREEPSESATIRCRLPIGTEVQVHERRPGWIRGSDCGPWISAAFAREVTAATRQRVREELLRARLAHPQGFATADRLIFLAESWARDLRDDRDAQARFALYELQALAMAAQAFDAGGALRSRFARWLGEQSPLFFYNEIGGGWMLRNAYIWTIHQRFHDTPAADDIAWFAAEHGVGGECEGDVGCGLSRADILMGAYLRAHPSGRHVDRALARITEWFDYGPEGPNMKDDGVTPQGTACRDAAAPLKALRTAVAATTSPRKEAALAVLERIAAACHGR